ncbi:MAG: poly(R)-hydroxyalkanoic acid synthase subunit PhaE [Pseudomonadota bacterium]
MTGASGPGPDILRLWLEANAALVAAGPGPLWQQAEAVHREWARFAQAFAEAHHARQSESASPFDPAGWLRPEGAGGMADLLRWLEGPTLSGAMGEYARAVQGGAEWLAYLAATEQLKAVLGAAWLAAFRRFLERFTTEDAQARAADQAPPGWQHMLALWRQVAGEALAETYRSPVFLAASRDLLRTETALRTRLREQVERVAIELGLPTRAELDDIHATLASLTRARRSERAAARRLRTRAGNADKEAVDPSP